MPIPFDQVPVYFGKCCGRLICRIFPIKRISINMEQPNVKDLVDKCIEKNISDKKIIDMLSSIIKQQMQYGGTLSDKVGFCLHEIKKPS